MSTKTETMKAQADHLGIRFADEYVGKHPFTAEVASRFAADFERGAIYLFDEISD